MTWLIVTAVAAGLIISAIVAAITLHKVEPTPEVKSVIIGGAYHYKPSQCNCIIFRMDDVQDYYLDAEQQQVIKTFEDMRVPLTVGVIGNQFGKDDTMVKFIKSQLDVGTIEVANHGWNHEDFGKISTVEGQQELMTESNLKIRDTLGVTPTTFITPFNAMNNNTVIAAAAAGLRVISADGDSSVQPFGMNTKVVELPATIAAGDLDPKSPTQWSGFSVTDITAGIHQSIDKYGFVVIMLHPQVFVDAHHNVDQDKAKALVDLLSSAKATGFKIMTLGQVADQLK